MKKRKLELYITGKLMSALMVGRPAIFSTAGEMYHTAPVVNIHHPLLHQAPPFCTRGPQPAPTNAGRVCVKG